MVDTVSVNVEYTLSLELMTFTVEVFPRIDVSWARVVSSTSSTDSLAKDDRWVAHTVSSFLLLPFLCRQNGLHMVVPNICWEMIYTSLVLVTA